MVRPIPSAPGWSGIRRCQGHSLDLRAASGRHAGQVTLALTFTTGLFLPPILPMARGPPHPDAGVAAGIFPMLLPGFQRYRSHEARQAARLFDRVTPYALAQFAIITVFVLL